MKETYKIEDFHPGQLVDFLGGPQFGGPEATAQAGRGNRRAGLARISEIIPDALNPILLSAEPDGGSTVNGWVRIETIILPNISTSEPQPEFVPETEEIDLLKTESVSDKDLETPAVVLPKEEEPPAPELTEFSIRVKVPALNVRREPHSEGTIVRQLVNDPTIYLISEEKDGWGKLKSGVGWILLKHTETV